MKTMIQIPASSKAPRNAIAIALQKRHGGGVKAMKDRRTPRAGSRNRQRDYAAGRY